MAAPLTEGVGRQRMKPARRCLKLTAIVKRWLGWISSAKSNWFSVCLAFCTTQGEKDITSIMLLLKSTS
ncbi:hypothetical protein G8A07_17440 [Roseateles sp. DAIF2]|uniref:hypothetical protein n=1 Tax=Roseateles sp. DAIF2 TaxID=2714952 RepID=UPI0018A2B9AC|nr:hypothetical protein [Roseateles sp. DAIF2]QPF74522.1 hypothetical protein G8A07_17440 [Roseateles sp. DAIF2]